jgi:hypothetical protein
MTQRKPRRIGVPGGQRKRLSFGGSERPWAHRALENVESLSQLPQPLVVELWQTLEPWRRRVRASELPEPVRLQLMAQERDVSVVSALADGCAPDSVEEALSGAPYRVRLVGTLRALDAPARAARVLELMTYARSRNIITTELYELFESPTEHPDVLLEALHRSRAEDVLHVVGVAQLDVRQALMARIIGCHADGRTARRFVTQLTALEPPQECEPFLRRTTRLGECHEVLRAWAALRLPAGMYSDYGSSSLERLR